jgi:hypothetical protein
MWHIIAFHRYFFARSVFDYFMHGPEMTFNDEIEAVRISETLEKLCLTLSKEM